MKVQCFAPTTLLVALSATQAVSAGIYLPVINSTFSNVSVQCSGDYALQSTNGGTCTSLDYPQQAFDGTTGIGWRFSLNGVPGSSSGLTGPNTSFNPPSFLGFPFSQAAFLQGADYGVAQTVGGFEAGATYRLAFYLGSRYANGDSDGNQTVVAYIDYHLLDVCTLVSDTPFTLRNAFFRVVDSGPHTLTFFGTASGDHTAFLSGVSIEFVHSADEE